MPRVFTAEDLWKLARVGRPVPAPDGSFAVVTVATFSTETDAKTERVWWISDGAEPRALTSPELSAWSPAISPDGERVAFLRKPAGKEHAQLWVLPLDGGEARRVTDLPLGVGDLRWFPDGARLAVVAPLYREAMTIDGTRELVEARAGRPVRPHVTEDRVYRFWDSWLTDGAVPHLFAIDARGDAPPVDLTPESERWWDLMDDTGQFAISPDGSELVFSADLSRPPHDRIRWALFVVPAAGGAARCLTVEEPGDALRPRYSPDGRAILYGWRRDPTNYADPVRLARLDRATGVTTVLTESWDRSPSAWEWIDDATAVAEVEDRGRVALFTVGVDAPGRAPRLLHRSGSVHMTVPAGGRVFVSHESMTQPPEAAAIALSDGALARLTRFNDAALAELELAGWEELELAGAAGDPVHMFLAYPPGFDPAKKWPLLMDIHGGPYGMHADSWHWRWNVQTFAAAGYVVALVNFHGSSSYGKAWAFSILGDWGGKAAQDLLLATDDLVARGFIDPARMAIAGGSFGGYMTLWLASQTDRFACAIAHAAVYNLDTIWACDVTQGAELELGGEPWGGPEARAAIARFDPASFTHGYRTPMLILHGEKDYRVPVTHALEVYGILKAKGVEARLVYFPDENHWILKPRNSLQWYDEFLGWLRRHLPSSPDLPAPTRKG